MPVNKTHEGPRENADKKHCYNFKKKDLNKINYLNSCKL
jgi:hypothetical protein